MYRDCKYVGSYVHVQWQQPQGWRPKPTSHFFEEDIGAGGGGRFPYRWCSVCSWQSCGDCHHFIVTSRLTYGRGGLLKEEVMEKGQDARHVWQIGGGQAEGADGVEATSPTEATELL